MRRVEVSSAEPPTLAQLLAEVERGEDVVLTREGRDVARLSAAPAEPRAWPPPYDAAAVAHRALDGLSALRDRLAARGVNLTDEQLRADRDDIRS